VLALCLALPSLASAGDHTVKPGQTLAGIAKRYDVTVWSLAAANRLEPTSTLKAGQVLQVPEKGVVYVNAGQTLWSVARRHGCTVEALLRTNGLKPGTSVRPGMRLVLPGHSPQEAGGRSNERDWGRPSHPGRVKLFRVGTGEKLNITLVDSRGRVRPEARRQMQRFMKPRNAKVNNKAPEKRLLSLLARVSDHFGGRNIHVISGVRKEGGYTKHESRHVKGAAIDLRVEGVSNRVLRDHLRHYDDVGVGFYPNSTFVHFDVRASNAYWVDISAPGQKPTYLTHEQRDVFQDEKARNADLVQVGEVVDEALEDMEHGEPEDVDVNDE
jgi:LysM repeat protein